MEFTNYFFIEWFISVVSFVGRTTDPFRFPLATSMRPLDGGGSMCTRVVTRHPCPEREWRIIDCSKDHRLVCSIHQPCGSQLEVYVHLLKSGLPMSTHLSPPPPWLDEETFEYRRTRMEKLVPFLVLGSSTATSLISSPADRCNFFSKKKGEKGRARVTHALMNERTNERTREDYTGWFVLEVNFFAPPRW